MGNHSFDVYEYVAIVVPGAALCTGVIFAWPDLGKLIADGSISIGGLGLFVIWSYLLGHIAQGGGQLLEAVFWLPLKGVPSSWIRFPGQRLIAATQRDRVQNRLRKQSDVPIEAISNHEWLAITREVYIEVSKANRTTRVDMFNRNYGLMRALSFSLIALTAGVLVSGAADWRIPTVLGGLALLTLWRMYRSAKYYARELFVEYASLPN